MKANRLQDDLTSGILRFMRNTRIPLPIRKQAVEEIAGRLRLFSLWGRLRGISVVRHDKKLAQNLSVRFNQTSIRNGCRAGDSLPTGLGVTAVVWSEAGAFDRCAGVS